MYVVEGKITLVAVVQNFEQNQEQLKEFKLIDKVSWINVYHQASGGLV